MKKLLDRRKEMQTAELLNAVMKSEHPYEDILRYINSKVSEEDI